MRGFRKIVENMKRRAAPVPMPRGQAPVPMPRGQAPVDQQIPAGMAGTPRGPSTLGTTAGPGGGKPAGMMGGQPMTPAAPAAPDMAGFAAARAAMQNQTPPSGASAETLSAFNNAQQAMRGPMAGAPSQQTVSGQQGLGSMPLGAAQRLGQAASQSVPGFAKGGLVKKGKKAPAKMAKGGMMCSPRKKMAMGGMVKGCKRSGLK